MKFLDSSFPSEGYTGFAPFKSFESWKQHAPRRINPPFKVNTTTKPLTRSFLEPFTMDQEQNQECNHVSGCRHCKDTLQRLLDQRIKEHWATKWLEVKNDIVEFLGLILLGVFILVLVDILTTRSSSIY